MRMLLQCTISSRMQIQSFKRLDKEGLSYIHNEILLSNQENKILTFAMIWIALEGIMLIEISESEKDKYDFCHIWNLRNKTDEHRGRKYKIR